MSQSHPPISIHCDDALVYSGNDWQPNRTYYVKIYSDFVNSGLLAKIPGNALKILLALALGASPLGEGSDNDRQFFEDLKAKKVFSETDHGRLFCYLEHDEICRQTGLSKNTVTAQTQCLVDLGLIEKRAIKKGRGDGTYNLFFIRPAAHIDKNNALHPEKNAHPKIGTAKTQSSPKNWDNNANFDSKLGTNLIDSDSDSDDWNIDSFSDYFAQRKHVSLYRPTAHDKKQLAALHADGCTASLMRRAIDIAFDTRPADAPPIRQLSYCAPIARQLMAEITVSPPKSATGDPASPAVDAIALYRQTFGAPPSEQTKQALMALVRQYPDTELLTEAFRRGKKHGAKHLAYIQKILKNEVSPAAAAVAPVPRPTQPPTLPLYRQPTQLEIFWENLLEQIRGQMTRAAFNQWIAPAQIVEMSSDRLVIGTKNVYAKEWLEHRLRKIVERAVSIINHGSPLNIEFTLL